jgi:CheY-like chemotaxis protein
MDRGGGLTVLVVEADADERDRLGTVLERGGDDVVLCSGPAGPDYVCIGGREGRCPLIDASDVVVLDLWLESDTLMMGTPAEELLRLYVSAGKPVITLGTAEPPATDFRHEPVTHLPRRPDPEGLLRAVRASARWLQDQAGLPIDR